MPSQNPRDPRRAAKLAAKLAARARAALSGVARRAWIVVLVLVLGISAVVGLGFSYLTPDCTGEGCPSLGDLESYRPPEPPHVFDREGALAGHLPGHRRIVLGLEEVPALLRDAYVAVEDRRFWEHGGVDVRSVLRAVQRNLAEGTTSEGASTITMQLARNIFAEDVLRYSPWHRKATEVRLALAMESRLSKREILELYLNQIYLGDGAYGVGAAAQHYFDKPVDDLEADEAAVLVGLAQSPEGYNPRRAPGLALARRNVVLDVMAREGVIEGEVAARAKERPLGVSEPSLVWDRGSHYAAAVRRELVRLLPEPRQRDGVRVFTALDRDLQAEAEEALRWQIERIEAGELGPWEHPTPPDEAVADSVAAASASPYLQGMVVAMDASTGSVRALVGGRDFSRSEFDRAFLARRQPGSAFKPFVLAAALDARRPLTDLVSTDSLTVRTPDSEEEEDSIWRLADYDPDPEDGDPTTVTLRDAVIRSSNVGTVRVGMQVGVEPVIQKARRLGIDTPIPPYPSVFLGSAEVVPAELVAAFATFENGGNRVEPHIITRIENADGRVIWEHRVEPDPVLDPRVAFLVRDVLSDVVNRGTAWRVRREVQGPAAGKTGTTNDSRDVWFVGMRPGIVAGVWLGFDRPRTITPGATGGEFAAPVWARFMSTLPDSALDSRSWSEVPSGITRARIDGGTGFLANESCPEESVRSEFFLEGTQPTKVCPIHGRSFFDRVVNEVRGLFGGDGDDSGPASGGDGDPEGAPAGETAPSPEPR